MAVSMNEAAKRAFKRLAACEVQGGDKWVIRGPEVAVSRLVKSGFATRMSEAVVSPGTGDTYMHKLTAAGVEAYKTIK